MNISQAYIKLVDILVKDFGLRLGDVNMKYGRRVVGKEMWIERREETVEGAGE